MSWFVLGFGIVVIHVLCTFNTFASRNSKLLIIDKFSYIFVILYCIWAWSLLWSILAPLVKHFLNLGAWTYSPLLQDQLGRVTLLSLFLFVVLGLTADTVLFSVSSRTPPSSLTGIPSIPLSFKGYSYRLFKFGPLQMTRKGLSLASTSACLTFTVSF